MAEAQATENPDEISLKTVPVDGAKGQMKRRWYLSSIIWWN